MVCSAPGVMVMWNRHEFIPSDMTSARHYGEIKRWEKGKTYFQKLNSKLQSKTKGIFLWPLLSFLKSRKTESVIISWSEKWRNGCYYLPQYFTITHISKIPPMPSLLSTANSFTQDGENKEKMQDLFKLPITPKMWPPRMWPQVSRTQHVYYISKHHTNIPSK